MWKSHIERVTERVLAGHLAGFQEHLRVLDERTREIRSDLNKLDLVPLEARMDSIENACENVLGDWALAKKQLQRLFGQITKATGLANGSAQEENSGMKTPEDVLRSAREKGLTR